MRRAPLPNPARRCPYCGARVSTAIIDAHCPRADRTITSLRALTTASQDAEQATQKFSLALAVLGQAARPNEERMRPKYPKGRR